MTHQRKARHWSWTLNNPTDDEFQSLADAFTTGGIIYQVYGREHFNTEGRTPHLQGYTIFEIPIRFTTVKNRLGSARFHIAPSRRSPEANRKYCTKDEDFEEFGILPESNQGRRTDLERVYDWGDQFAQDNLRPPTTPEIAREFPVQLTRNPGITRIMRLRFEAEPLETGDHLNDWQQELEDHLAQEPDDREIRFYVDHEGGKGKSWFVRYYLSKYPETTQMLSVGKRDDLAHTVKIQTKVFLVLIPRNQMEFLQYSVLEQIKDRLVFSPKYNSEVKKLLHTPHVVVFCNEDPDYEKLTQDRYDVIQL